LHSTEKQASKQALQHSPELFVDVDAVGEAVETGLKDLMLFLFFGMPGTSSALLSTAVTSAVASAEAGAGRVRRQRETVNQSANPGATTL
jgi:hypothetical protein